MTNLLVFRSPRMDFCLKAHFFAYLRTSLVLEALDASNRKLARMQISGLSHELEQSRVDFFLSSPTKSLWETNVR